MKSSGIRSKWLCKIKSYVEEAKEVEEAEEGSLYTSTSVRVDCGASTEPTV